MAANHATASMPDVSADTPLFAQGESETRPMPDPSAISTRDEAKATTAPAITADHDTADAADGSLSGTS